MFGFYVFALKTMESYQHEHANTRTRKYGIMKQIETSAGTLIQSDPIAGIDGVVHGFGVRGVTQAQYLDALGIKDRYILDTHQIHSKTVHCLMYPKGGSVMEGDAFITDRPGLVCYVRTADCDPILIADKKNRAVAAVHAGWKGTALNIVDETLKAMNSVYGTQPTDCVVAMGPAICGKCYEVGEEVVEALSNTLISFPQSPARDGAGLKRESSTTHGIPRSDRGTELKYEWLYDSSHVDLKIANLTLLEKAGISKSNIDLSESCTYCDSTFNSWRRDHSEEERQFSFIMLK